MAFVFSTVGLQSQQVSKDRGTVGLGGKPRVGIHLGATQDMEATGEAARGTAGEG